MSNTFTALCLHEHYFESPESPWAKASESYRDGYGSLEWRDRIEQIAEALDYAWGSLSDDDQYNLQANWGCWDFDIVPAIADHLSNLCFNHKGISNAVALAGLLELANWEVES